MSNTCSFCNRTYVWPADLKRHLKSKHGQQKSTLKQQQPYTFTSEQQQQQYIFIPEQQQYTFVPDQQEIQWKTEEPYYMIQINNSYHFTFPINMIQTISCLGSIHLPVWSRDQPEMKNPSLLGDSYTISDIWWPQYRITSSGVMENTRL